MDLYDLAAGAKLAHDHADDMEDKVNTIKDLVRTLSVYGKLLTDADDQSAFQRIGYMVQDAHEELEQVRSEIVAATDLDRMRSPQTWAFKQIPFNQKRGTGMHFNDDGDVFLEWQHGDGRRTGTQYAAVMNYERDDRGGISSETPVRPKKVKEAA